MKLINSKENGYLTVFLSLILTVILSLCLVLVEGARTNGARFMTEYAMDVGMNSILAEYHRELLEQYDVFFLDTSYGSDLPSAAKTAERLQYYADRNFSCEDLGLRVYKQDLYGLSVQNICIGNLAVATDEQGKVFRKQAIQYMSDKYELTALEKVQGWKNVVEEYQLDDGDITSRRNVVDQQIEEADGSKIQLSEEEWVTVEVENPADAVNAERSKGVLWLTMKDTDCLSNACFQKELAASYRKLYQGQGPIAKRKATETLPQLFLFDMYLLEKCSYYGRELEKSHMKYQLEYLLAGKDNDLDNLKSVASRLLLIRETANAAYLFADEGKRIQAAALAAGISAVVLLPALQQLLEYSILFAWAFAESVYDVRSLFDGGKVPLMKTDSNWHTDIKLLFDRTEDDGSRSEEGLTYADYLQTLLALTDTESKTMRFLDMAELDIRKTPGNENFRMDGCIDGMRIEVNVISRHQDVFLVQRDCCYE